MIFSGLFDGDNDYVDITNGDQLTLNAIDSAFSFFITPDFTGDNFMRVVDKSTGIDGTDGYSIAIENDGSIYFYVDTVLAARTSPGTLDGTRQNVIIQHTDGVSTQVYIGGVEATYVTQNPATMPSTAANLRLGSWNHTDGVELKGQLGNFSIYSGVLTSGERDELAAGNISPTNILTYWAFNERSGENLQDVSGNGYSGTIQNLSTAFWEATQDAQCACAVECLKPWVFLGLSIKGFSVNVGWNTQETTLSVDLIEDPCEDVEKCKLDEKFNVTTFTGADPGFIGYDQKIIGVPVCFRYEDFEFAGIVARWNESTDTSGIRKIKIDVVSPQQILDGVNIIIDNYIGPTNQVPNLINAYALYEGVDCSTFGNSGNLGKGMSWSRIKHAATFLTSIVNPLPLTDIYLQDNRVKYVAGLNGGCGLVREDDTGYLLDLSEIPDAPFYYRFQGKSVNLMQAIQSVIDDAGMDFFVDFLPCCINGDVLKIIKFRVVDRTGQPALNSIQTFIDTNVSECGLKNYSRGVEMRNDTMNTFVCGPCQQGMWFVEWVRNTNFVDSTYPTIEYSDCTEQTIRDDLILRLADAQAVLTAALADPNNTGHNGQNCGAIADVDEQNNCWNIAIYQRAVDELQARLDSLDEHIPSGTRKTCRTVVNNPIRIYDLNDDLIQPFWGLDANGNAIISRAVDFNPLAANPGFWQGPQGSPVVFDANTYQLQQNLFILNAPATLTINEGELLSALAGYDIWQTYTNENYTQTYQLVEVLQSYNGSTSKGLHNHTHVINHINEQSNLYRLKPIHMLALRKVATGEELDTFIENDERVVFDWVLNYAQSYYGRQFMVKVPDDICAYLDPNTGEPKFSVEITDGGWNHDSNGVEFNPLIGIDTTGIAMDFFRLPDGRIRPYVRFDDADLLIFDHLNEDEFGYIDFGNGHLWVKVSVKPHFVWEDAANLIGPRVVIELPQAIRFKETGVAMNREGFLVDIDLNQEFQPAQKGIYNQIYQERPGGSTLSEFRPERAVQPNAATVALKSNKGIYGPWFNNSSFGAGQTRVEEDVSLTPWNFGSMAAMTAAGQSIADLGVSTMYCSETGTLTVPGIPQLRIGDELLAYEGNGYILNQYYASTRITQTTTSTSPVANLYYSLPLIQQGTGIIWVGLYGPVVTGISVQANESGLCTTYTLDTFRKSLKRFSKVRAEALKEVGQLRQELLNWVQNHVFNGGS